MVGEKMEQIEAEAIQDSGFLPEPNWVERAMLEAKAARISPANITSLMFVSEDEIAVRVDSRQTLVDAVGIDEICFDHSQSNITVLEHWRHGIKFYAVDVRDCI